MSLSVLSYFFIKYHASNVALFRRNKCDGVKMSLFRGILPMCLVIVGGVCFQVANNLQFIISARSFFFVVITVFCLAILVIVLAWALFADLLENCTFDSLGLAFCISWLFLPTVQSVLKFHDQASLLFILIVSTMTCLLILLYRLKKSFVTAFFFLFAITSVLILGVKAYQESRITSVKKLYVHDAREDIMKGLRSSHEGGVYFLVYDAMPDVKTMAALGIDSSPLTNLLEENNFKIYNDTYSLGRDSLRSDALVLDIKEQDGTREFKKTVCQKINAGNSLSFSVMKSLGYNLKNYLMPYFIGDFCLPQIEYLPQYDSNGKYVEAEMRSVFLSGLFEGEFNFDQKCVEFFEYQFIKTKKVSAVSALRSVNHKNDFVVCHFDLPGHSQNSGKLLPNETQLFIERYQKALKQMKGDLAAILKHDPNALIIITGDHGPYLTGDGAGLASYKISEITELMIRDRLGTFVSIRWPDPQRARKYDKKLLVNQDIFPVVWAYLCDSVKPLQLLVQNRDGYFHWGHGRFRGHVFIKDGVFQKK
jgi:hypothetical protein